MQDSAPAAVASEADNAIEVAPTPPASTQHTDGPRASAHAAAGRRLGAGAVPYVVLLVAVGAAAKLPETVLPIGTDTGMYATYGRMILQGQRPYVDFFDVHPPLAYVYWALVQAIAGTDWSRTCLGAWGSVLAPQPCIGLLAHAFDLGLTCVAALLAYGIARRLALPSRVGLLAGVFIVWFANISMISDEGSTPGKLTLVPATLAVYAFARALEQERPRWRWVLLAGAAGAMAGIAKQPGLVTLLALFVYSAPGCFRRDITTRLRARRLCIGLAVGAVAVGIAVCCVLWWVGSLQGFLDLAWIYNGERFLIGYWQTPAGLTSPDVRIDRIATQSAGLLFVGALLGALALLNAPTTSRQRLLLVWAGCNLLAVAGFREFAQVVPSFALLAAVGIDRLWVAARTGGLGLGNSTAGRVGLVAVLGTVFLLSSGFQLVELRRAWFERGPRGTPSDPELIAGYLRTDVAPGPLFVWGNAGHIYALSGRDPASRFVIAEFTNLFSPRPTRSRTEVMADLQAHPPSVIIIAPHSDGPDLQVSGFPMLADLLAACYERISPATPTPSWQLYGRLSSTDCSP